VLAEYKVSDSLDSNTAYIRTLASTVDGPFHIVTHSLGGILGIVLAKDNKKVLSLTTISAPFGGSKAADVMRWLSNHEVYHSLVACPSILRDIQNNPLHCPHSCIITTGGNNPVIHEPNDGVVSIKSQLAISGASIIKIPLNHFEVLLSDATIEAIQKATNL
jgi:triacylglycerol esterase/lipase EstA (alpha/beta hydrolase family)